MVQLIELPKILDERGNLSFFESGNFIPFSIERVYWIYDVPGGEQRGAHASVSGGSLSTGTRDQKTWSIPGSGSYKLSIKSSDDYGSTTAELNVSVGGCP